MDAETERRLLALESSHKKSISNPVRPGGFSIIPATVAMPLAGAVAAVTWNPIPQIYSFLELVLYGRGDTAATFVIAQLTFNNDGTAIYDYNRTNITGAVAPVIVGTAANAANFCQAATFSAATATANVFDSYKITIPAYANSTGHKSYRSDGTWLSANTLAGTAWHHSVGKWRSTAPITRIDLTASAGNFIIGCDFRLLGYA